MSTCYYKNSEYFRINLKQICITFDANRLYINPNESVIGFITTEFSIQINLTDLDWRYGLD